MPYTDGPSWERRPSRFSRPSRFFGLAWEALGCKPHPGTTRLTAEVPENVVIKPSDLHNKLDRQNLLEQAQKIWAHLLDGELGE
jgi:hypothetical protein